MEIAGLEPATSWVRPRRSRVLSLACLRGFCGAGDPVGALHFRSICAHFGWDRAKEATFWPELGSGPATSALLGRPSHTPPVTTGAGCVRRPLLLLNRRSLAAAPGIGVEREATQVSRLVDLAERSVSCSDEHISPPP